MALEEYRQREMARGLDQWQSLAQDSALGARSKQLSKKLFLGDATVAITEKQAQEKLNKHPQSARYSRKAEDYKQIRKDLTRAQGRETKALEEEESFQVTLSNFQDTLAKDPADRTPVEVQMIETGVTVKDLSDRLDEQEQVRQKLTETRRKMEKSLAEVGNPHNNNSQPSNRLP